MNGQNYQDDDRPIYSEGIWHFLNRVLILLILFGLITLFVCAFEPEMKKRQDQKSRLNQLHADLDRERLRNLKLVREKNLLTTDPEYVELIARDKLDLMKDGETIFRIDPDDHRSEIEKPVTSGTNSPGKH